MNAQSKITLSVNGNPRRVISGQTLSEYLHHEKPCGGHGRCGKCKVIAVGELSPMSESEYKLLSEEERSKGFRLACLTTVQGDCSVFIPQIQTSNMKVITAGEMPEFELNPLFEHFGAVIDIGTTTIAAKLYTKDGSLLSETVALNPQIVWGGDVISRIEAALSGKASSLSLAIRTAVDDILMILAQQASISVQEMDGLVITGNTAMLYLLTETDTGSLSHAPFTVHRYFNETLTAAELGLYSVLPQTSVYLPQCLAAFIGADVTCGILAISLCQSEKPAILVDIGTNGEMGLWANGQLTVCSTAAGPAFEGVGISMGMRSASGAIDRVSIVNGDLLCHVIDNQDAIGICGSGLIDAAACLLRLGEMDDTGYLEEGTFFLADHVTLNQSDIRMLQLAKSAIYAGITALLSSAQISVTDIDSVTIAGGFGKYLNLNNAEYIGLFPAGLHKKIRTAGNTALTGASMLLLNRDFQETCSRIAQKTKVLELSSNPVFTEQYMMGMTF